MAGQLVQCVLAQGCTPQSACLHAKREQMHASQASTGYVGIGLHRVWWQVTQGVSAGLHRMCWQGHIDYADRGTQGILPGLYRICWQVYTGYIGRLTRVVRFIMDSSRPSGSVMVS